MNKWDKKLSFLFKTLEFLVLFEVVLGLTAYFSMLKGVSGGKMLRADAESGITSEEEIPQPFEVIIDEKGVIREEAPESDVITERAILLHPVQVEILGDLMKEEAAAEEGVPGQGEEVPSGQEGEETEGTVSENTASPEDPENQELYDYAMEIRELMLERRRANLEEKGEVYEALEADVMDNIDFYEALLCRAGESEETVASFYGAYERMLSAKEQNENVVMSLPDGEVELKDEFRQILSESGVSSNEAMRDLTLALAKDQRLYENNDIEALQGSHYMPYEIGLTTRENMMLAAMSLVGRVRYVWGGGHSGASYIKGINPVWKQWEELYPHEAYTIVSGNEVEDASEEEGSGDAGSEKKIRNDGYRKCIKPSGSWCPIHGYVRGDFHGETIYSPDEYIEARSELFDGIDLTDPKYREMLSTVDYSNGVNAHVLDGLDCSGYMSWVFNQITDRYQVNTAARYFTDQVCFKELPMNSKLLPGDVWAWEKHIVGIIGKAREGSRAYVTIEETPNVLRFGVAYYTGASEADLSYAKKIAMEANALIGGIDPEEEPPHVYCINTAGIKTVKVYDEEEESAGESAGDEERKDSEEQEEKQEDEAEEWPEEEEIRKEEKEPEAGWKEQPSDRQEEQTGGENGEIVEIIEEITPPSEPSQPVEEPGTGENDPGINPGIDPGIDPGINPGFESGFDPEYDGEEAQGQNSRVAPLRAYHTETRNTMRIAYFREGYLDENEPVDESGKLLKDMTAYEIISHTISKLPYSWLEGYNTYDGELWPRSIKIKE